LSIPQQILADAVYWRIFVALASESIRRCADPKCGRFFVATNSRMRYRPSPVGRRSRCMNRHNVEKHRARQRRKQAEE
jgi:hypothetical protein